MPDLVGIHPAPPGADTKLPTILRHLEPKYDWFLDDREGVDRWGRTRKGLKVIGDDWNTHYCVLQADHEACYGEMNPGCRVMPDELVSCEFECGRCGGGGEALSETYGICCATRGADVFEAAVDEIMHVRQIDNLRIDLARVPVIEPAGGRPWVSPALYFPTVEWGGRHWMEALDRYVGQVCPACRRVHRIHGKDWPMIATTAKTWAVSTHAKNPTPLRDRLGGFTGHLVVTGYTKDDMIDDAWDDRKHLFKWLVQNEVDTVITNQYSTYSVYGCSMWIYNAQRTFQWYQEAVEAGIPNVVLDFPPDRHAKWLMNDWIEFVKANRVPIIALSWQQFGVSSARIANALYVARTLHKELPIDTAIIIVGVGAPQKVATFSRIFAGRSLAFTTVEAYARAAFYELVPQGTSAPKMEHVCDEHSTCRFRKNGTPRASCKTGVFVHNVLAMAEVVEQMHGKAQASALAHESRKRRSA